DHDHAVQEITRLLIEAGHTRIALVNGPPDFYACRLRAEGYRSALDQAGLAPMPPRTQDGPFSAEHGYRSTIEMLDAPVSARPTAIVAASDLIAAGCLDAANARGLRVPTDLAITGFDDSILAS